MQSYRPESWKEGKTTVIPDDRGDLHKEIWGEGRPLVGMVHLLPLPGSPQFAGSVNAVADRAASDAHALSQGGVDGILVENYGDAPFFPRSVPTETVAAMGAVVRELAREATVPVGVNVLRNDADAALAVAVATGARFIRVNVHTGSMFTDQGILEGSAHRTLRKRASLGKPIQILADIIVKHASPPPGLTLEQAAEDTWNRGLADGVVITGSGTGRAADPRDCQRVRDTLGPNAKIWVGSGVTPQTGPRYLSVTDGLIVGSVLQRRGKAGAGVDPDRVRAFMEEVRKR
jgi:membrane complex biogenesis BtpA family protein